MSEVINTFLEHKQTLTYFFNVNRCIPDRFINPPFGLSFLIILEILVTREQQTKMYRIIKDEIINADQHEHLIWKVLIPQWALEIFKTKFGLSQDEALRQIKIQDAAEIQNQSNFDLEL